MKSYSSSIDFEIAAINKDQLLEAERRLTAADNSKKPFRLAKPVAVDLDIAKKIRWIEVNGFAFGKFTIRLNGAMSSSINFDRFYLPAGTEMFIYNQKGNMITGPITEKENNSNSKWGSWVYKGDIMIIEVKTPVSSRGNLLLHANNIAYGYKEIYKTKVGGFGNAGSCNINVICSLGNGWEDERNSVNLILDENGEYWCSGAMIMNTCNTNRPFVLTADHCLDGQDVSDWRFTFQAWSPDCSPGSNASGVTYNGATLRANWFDSDFCLVELDDIPPANSNIRYAGWTRSTTPASSAIAIHHPSGDVMKISESANGVTSGTVSQHPTNYHWKASWTQGVTEPGSSGSPLFDQNHRIIGQLTGGPSYCGGPHLWDFYGKFDLSWAGGGTNSTRLSNWLDPTNTNATTANTTNISSLTSVSSAAYQISGPSQFCSSSNYSISNLPGGASVSWYISNAPFLSYSQTSNVLTVNRISDGDATITAIVTICSSVLYYYKNIRVGGDPITLTATQLSCDEVQLTVTGAAGAATYNWSSVDNTVLFNGLTTTATTFTGQITGITTTANNTIVVDATNTCSQSQEEHAIFLPYEREISGLYPEYISCGDHLSVSVNTTPYDSYYRWYVNNQLVKQGAYASSYCTCSYEGPDERVGGDNTVRVEVETGCAIPSSAGGEFFWYCGVYRMQSNVELFPNPTKGQVTIRLKEINKGKSLTGLRDIQQVRVFDKIGTLRKQYKFPANSTTAFLNLNGLPLDIYIVEVTDGKNNKERLQVSVRQ